MKRWPVVWVASFIRGRKTFRTRCRSRAEARRLVRRLKAAGITVVKAATR